MKIIVLDGYTLNPGDLSWDGLKNLGEVTVYDRTAPADVVAHIGDAPIILTNKVIIDRNIMQACPKLKYIGVLATGYNVVDINAAHELGITVTNIPAYSTASVAQMVFAHVLNITQRVGHYAEEVRQGVWTACPDFSYSNTPLWELQGKRIGIVGLGNTGYNTARIAIGFGMKVYAYTSKSRLQLPPEIRKVELDELFATCDVVSLHCPLTTDTHHLVNESRLKLMKPTAILINTGRGPLVDEQALADALNNGTIYAAGVDVLSTEPPTANNPLLAAKNCFITPHIAWATKEARQRLMEIACDNVEQFIKNKPQNVVSK